MSSFVKRDNSVPGLELLLDNPCPVYLMGDNVHIEDKAILSALKVLEDKDLHASKMVLTPDLHYKSGIPVGVCLQSEALMPQMIGRDIGCGMRLVKLEGLNKEEVIQLKENPDKLENLSNTFRDIFFLGQRNILTSPSVKNGIFREGIPALLNSLHSGMLEKIENEDRLFKNGSLTASKVWTGYDKYINASKDSAPDSQLGSLGGGNHFCELDFCENVYDPQTAYQMRLQKDDVLLFIHSGSLALGSALGSRYNQTLYKESDILEYLQYHNNAANFAFCNRLSLSLMALTALEETLQKELSYQLIYDAPHNFILETNNGYLHRKGATPAEDFQEGDPFAFGGGRPALVPGSMGSSSYVLQGKGKIESLQSVAHGAGRVLSRGKAAKEKDEEAEKLTVVTPVNIKQMQRQGRKDIAEEAQKRINEESPHAYKSIESVVSAIETAGAAQKVAEIRPLLTIKG